MGEETSLLGKLWAIKFNKLFFRAHPVSLPFRACVTLLVKVNLILDRGQLGGSLVCLGGGVLIFVNFIITIITNFHILLIITIFFNILAIIITLILTIITTPGVLAAELSWEGVAILWLARWAICHSLAKCFDELVLLPYTMFVARYHDSLICNPLAGKMGNLSQLQYLDGSAVSLLSIIIRGNFAQAPFKHK